MSAHIDARHLTHPLVTALLALLLPVMVIAQETPRPLRAGGLQAYHASDSDDFSVSKLSAAYYTDYQHLDHKVGLRYSEIRYGQNGWSREGRQLNLMQQRVARNTGAGWLVDLGLLQQGGRDTVTAEANYRQGFGEGHSAEVFVSRDVIETRAALENGRDFTFAGASADLALAPQWTVVGLAGVQSISDGNQRRHLRGRLIYQPWTDLGVTVQARYRYFDSSRDDVSGAYFNPKRYDEGMLAVSWRQRVQHWRTQLVGGLGQQRINDDSPSPTRLLEASAEKQASRYAVRLRAGYTQSASFGGPDYRWRYVNAELVVPF